MIIISCDVYDALLLFFACTWFNYNIAMLCDYYNIKWCPKCIVKAHSGSMILAICTNVVWWPWCLVIFTMSCDGWKQLIDVISMKKCCVMTMMSCDFHDLWRNWLMSLVCRNAVWWPWCLVIFMMYSDGWNQLIDVISL